MLIKTLTVNTLVKLSKLQAAEYLNKSVIRTNFTAPFETSLAICPQTV